MNGTCCANETIPSRILIKECVTYTWKFLDGILGANIQHHIILYRLRTPKIKTWKNKGFIL